MTQEPNKQEDKKSGSSKKRFGKKQVVISVIVAVVLGACGLAYALNSAHEAEFVMDGSGWARNQMAEQERAATLKQKVVRAVRDIPEGATVKLEDVAEEEMLMAKVPQDAYTSTSILVGRTAKYGISKGELVLVSAVPYLDEPQVESPKAPSKESKHPNKHHK